MTAARFDDEESFASSPAFVGALLQRTGHGNLHLGVIYRAEAGVFVAHMAWENCVLDQWEGRRLWAAPEILDVHQAAAAGVCRLFVSQCRNGARVPYGFRHQGCKISGADGLLQLGLGSSGMTCSTFFLVLLKSVGADLIDESTWPVRSAEDIEFVEWLRANSKSRYTGDVIARLLLDVLAGSRRIRPEEVFGACAHVPLVKFDDARVSGANAVALHLPPQQAT